MLTGDGPEFLHLFSFSQTVSDESVTKKLNWVEF